jgi:hypothetical protein
MAHPQHPAPVLPVVGIVMLLAGALLGCVLAIFFLALLMG